MIIRFLLFLFAIVHSAGCASQGQNHNTDLRPTYRVHETSSLMVIDGVLSEDEWGRASSSASWNDVATCEPHEPDTRFKCSSDEKYLYVAVIAKDMHVTASIREENQPLFQFDPTIEVFLDPGADGINYYEFQVNPFGAKWQLKLDKPYKQGGKATNPYEIAGLKVAVHIDGTINDSSDIDRGWSIEIAIPWEELETLHPDARTTMNANFGRVVQKTNSDGSSQEYYSWSCAGASDMHRPDTWGNLIF